MNPRCSRLLRISAAFVALAPMPVAAYTKRILSLQEQIIASETIAVVSIMSDETAPAGDLVSPIGPEFDLECRVDDVWYSPYTGTVSGDALHVHTYSISPKIGGRFVAFLGPKLNERSEATMFPVDDDGCVQVPEAWLASYTDPMPELPSYSRPTAACFKSRVVDAVPADQVIDCTDCRLIVFPRTVKDGMCVLYVVAERPLAPDCLPLMSAPGQTEVQYICRSAVYADGEMARKLTTTRNTDNNERVTICGSWRRGALVLSDIVRRDQASPSP